MAPPVNIVSCELSLYLLPNGSNDALLTRMSSGLDMYTQERNIELTLPFHMARERGTRTSEKISGG